MRCPGIFELAFLGTSPKRWFTAVCVFVLAVTMSEKGWAQVSISSTGTAFTQDFNSLGTSATATLPTGFRVNTSANWTSGTSATTLAAGTSGAGALTGISGGGTYNFASGITASSTDRALGFLTSGGYASPRYIIYAFTNNTGVTVSSLDIVFDYEKYRTGTRAWDMFFYHGSTAASVTTSATSGDQTYASDASNAVVDPPSTINKSFTISGLSISNGTTYYLAWGSVGNSGSTNSQGIGIDNFSITACSSPTPTFTVAPTVTTCAGTSVTYTTQSGQSNYVWSVPGTVGTNYNIITGGIGSGDYTVTLAWLTAGSKTVTVGYTSSGCASITPASNSTTVTTTTTSIAPTTTQTIPTSTNGTTLNASEGTNSVTSRLWKYSTTSGGPYTISLGQTGTSYAPNFASPGTYYVVVETVYGSPCNNTVTSNEVQINVASHIITTTSASYGPYCNATSNNISVAFTSTGSFAGNFFVQLSDASGIFPANSTSNIISGGSVVSPISATVPVSQTAGTGYRVRVVNDNPATQSFNDNGSNITINSVPSVNSIAGGAGSVCVNGTTAAFTNATGGGVWSIVNGTGSASITAGGVVTGLTAGTVSVVYTVTSGACSNSANTGLTVNALATDPSGSISIGANPACSNTSISFSAPSSTTYWQTSAAGTSTTSNTLSGYSVSSSGTYYVRAYNGNCWSTNSVASAAITINSPALITVQPTNKSVTAPASTSFSVTASNATSYQWQVDAGAGWINISNGATYSGATTAALAITATTESMDGYGYRVVIGSTSPCTSVTSNIVSLAVAPTPCGPTETFTNIPTASSTSYLSRSWTGDDGGTWTATDARTDQTILSSKAITIRSGVLTSPIFTSGIGNLSFTTNFPFSETNGTLEIRVNGTLIYTVLYSAMNGSTPVTINVNNINISGNVVLTLTSSGSRYSIDNLSWTCYTQCTPTATVTSFVPATGPAGTWVTITGTGFTGATEVKFGGISASSFTVESSTIIKAKVPTNALTGAVSVTVSSCPASSSGSFTVIGQTNCSSGSGYASDLFISEVYDAASGSLGYIEIFNGTNAAVSLTNYTIRIRTGTSTDNDYAMSGTLSVGAVYILRIGSSSSSCSGFTINNNQSSAPGYNGNDQVFLLKSGSIIDYAPNPNSTYAGGTGSDAPGFSQVRKNTVTAPSSTYISSQWTNSTAESCSDLGIAPYIPGGSSVTINPGPSDYTICSTPITFSASHTGTGTGSNSPLWKVYNPLTSAWVNASELQTSTSSFGLTSTITTSNTNTDNMSVSGNVAQLQGYQFYIEVTRGSCVAASSAARYSYSTLPVYRSKSTVTSGDWLNASNWEMASTTSGPWISTCSYPVASNSSQVIIQSGSSIVLSDDIDIDKVTIETNAQLELSSTGKLSLNDSSAAEDLTINGTLYDRASSGNGINYGSGATYLLGASGTVIKSNTSSGANYRDKYYNGISNMPSGAAGAKFVFRYNGDGNPSVVAAGMYYPNLYFENTNNTGLFDFKSSTMALSGGTGGYCTINGSLYIGTTGTGQVKVYNNNINTQPMIIYGNIEVGTGSTLTNQSHDGLVDASHGNGSGFILKGNFQNAGTFSNNYGTGVIILSGSAAQVLSGSASCIYYTYDLMVANSSGITLQRDLDVFNQFTFISGIVTTAATPNGLLTMRSAALPVAGFPGDATYVKGPMAKQFAIGSTTEYFYPVGKPGGFPTAYNPCYVVPVSIVGAITTFTSEYFPGAHQAQGIMGINLIGITNKEYWDINKSPSNSSFARVKLYYNNPGSGNWIYYTGASSSPYYITATDPCWYCNVAVVHREVTTTWNFTKTSAFNAIDPEYRFYTNEGWIFSNAISSFSPFTLGYTYGSILPVKLLSFSGRLINTDGKLDWKIADATDLDGFELEYSRDGRTFKKLTNIPSNGSVSYGYLHKDLLPGASYYRLLVKEKSGNRYYSQVVILNRGKLVTYVVGVSTGNSGNQLNTVVYSSRNQKLQASITDILGRQLLSVSNSLTQGSNQWLIETSMLPKGLYFVTLRSEDGMKETSRFLKE